MIEQDEALEVLTRCLHRARRAQHALIFCVAALLVGMAGILVVLLFSYQAAVHRADVAQHDRAVIHQQLCEANALLGSPHRPNDEC